MHPDLEEILAVRDGEAAPEAARHVASCPECALELERLRAVRNALRSLPSEEPSRDLWAETRVRIKAETARPRWIGVAAVLALTLSGAALVWLFFKPGGSPAPERHIARAGVPDPGGNPAPPPAIPEEETGGPIQDPELARLIRNSHRLESVLDRMDEGPAVVSGREALAEMSIEDRLARLDARLGAGSPGKIGPEEQMGLWQERVHLLGTLTQVKGGKRRTAEI